jgi:hypothetical protein
VTAPPPDPAEAAYLQKYHAEFVELFMASSVGRYLAGERGGGQEVFYECRRRLKHSLKNDHVTCLTRMFGQRYPHMPLYTYRHAKADPVMEPRPSKPAPQAELFGMTS